MLAITPDVLRRSWRAWLGGDPRPVGPRWLRLMWTLAFAASVALVFTLLGYAALARGQGDWRSLGGWWYWYRMNLVVSLCIALSIHGLFHAGYRLFGISKVQGLEGSWRTLYFAGLPMLGTAIGWPLGVQLTGYRGLGLQLFKSPNTLVGSILVGAVITLVFQLLFNAKARQLQAEKRAAEAQLRLLQGQIEPHFLFNTLANVAALIDHDAPLARQMLESFTDYLRASLTSLRAEHATLGSELDLAQAYLELLKARMDDRLQFSIDVDPALRGARLPPLLLQPLIENAIHHGLEPKIEGGTVHISARREGVLLRLEVADDGLGLNAHGKRRGAGVALANLRERLQTRFGSAAGLSLQSAPVGAVATLFLPFEETTSP